MEYWFTIFFIKNLTTGINMEFKSDAVREEFENSPVILQVLADEFEKISLSLDIKPVMVRVKQEIPGDSGVHGSYRAIDFRDEHVKKFKYTKNQSKLICDYMNEKFKRLDKYVTCIHHSFNGGPYHFHIQAPLNTECLRGPLYKQP